VTTNGPLAPSPYFLRLTKDGHPDAGAVYNIGDSGPDGIDQRAVVDPSFLELVRLGVLPATDPDVVATLPVIDAQLGVPASNPQFCHRYNRDGYGEQPDGRPWDIGFPPAPLNSPWSSQATIGRIWPIFAGERGEYQLAAGRSAAARVAAMAATANDGYLLPGAGVGRLPAVRRRRLRTDDRDLLGDATGVVARAVHPAGLVDHRRRAGRAAVDRRLPLREDVPLDDGPRIRPERRSRPRPAHPTGLSGGPAWPGAPGWSLGWNR
jgi:hypothetical protein